MSKAQFKRELILSVSRIAGTNDPKIIAKIISDNGEEAQKAMRFIAASQIAA